MCVLAFIFDALHQNKHLATLYNNCLIHVYEMVCFSSNLKHGKML